MRTLIRFVLAWLLLTSSVLSGFPPPQSQPGRGEFKDPRDSQVYPTFQIAGMTWFAKNLNHAAPRSYCYDNRPENCEKYGRMYRWEAALAVCPDGWHLSTELEWQALELALGLPFAELLEHGNRGSTQGARLKRGGDIGFDAQYSGWRKFEDQTYEGRDRAAALWTATEYNMAEAWHRDIDIGDEMVYRSPEPKDYALSVRCVQNRSERDLKKK